MHLPLSAAINSFKQARKASSGAGVPIARQIPLLLQMRAATGMSGDEFYRYQLWRPGVTLIHRFGYGTLRERMVSGPRINPFETRRELAAKSAGVECMSQAGAPVPELLAIIAPGVKTEGAGVPHLGSMQELSRWLAGPRGGVVIKPEDGKQGTDVLVGIDVNGDGLIGVDGSLLPIGVLWNAVEARGRTLWRIERRVVAHPELCNFRSDIVPSLRVQAVVIGEEVTVHAATLKIPSGNSGIDNLSKGNLGSPVDLDTWSLGSAIRLGSDNRHTVHPETGAPIEGLKLPLEAEVRGAVEVAARAMLPLRCLGFDVALSDRGPVIFEGNPRFMADVVQLPQGRGLVYGSYLRLLHEMGVGHVLEGRRARSAEWRRFEDEALAGDNKSAPIGAGTPDRASMPA